MREICVSVVSVVFVCCAVFGAYWVVKHVSYAWWYEDMVKQTIRQMVNETALKGSVK